MSNKKKPSTEDLLLSAFVGVESAHAFSAFNPSIFTINSLAVPQGQEALIRAGYLPSIAFSVALGSIIGLFRKTWLPIAFGLGTSAFMVTIYEAAIHMPPQNGGVTPQKVSLQT